MSYCEPCPCRSLKPRNLTFFVFIHVAIFVTSILRKFLTVRLERVSLPAITLPNRLRQDARGVQSARGLRLKLELAGSLSGSRSLGCRLCRTCRDPDPLFWRQSERSGQLQELHDVQPAGTCFDCRKALLGPPQLQGKPRLRNSRLLSKESEASNEPPVPRRVDRLGSHGRASGGRPRNLWYVPGSVDIYSGRVG